MSHPDSSSAFSVTAGGPFFRLARLLRLAHGDGNLSGRLPVLVVVVTWVPLCALGVLAWRATGHLPPIMKDFGVHVRLLVALPLFFFGERSLHARSRRCIDRFVGEGWSDEGQLRFSQLAAVVARWRDAAAPEIIALALAVFGSQAVFWGGGEPLGISRGRADETDWSSVVGWYRVMALPVFQFFFYRWLWRWIVWARLLWRLSRLHVRPVATHPDRQGGLSFLSEPSVSFAYFLMGVSAVQAAVWANRVVVAHVSVTSFKVDLAIALVLGILVAIGPVLPFVGALWRARFDAVRDYGRLGADLTRLFHARWIERGERDGLLGTADASTMIDYASVYEIVRKMRMVPFGVQIIVVLVAAIAAPMIPLVLLEVPVVELVRKLGEIALGSRPP